MSVREYVGARYVPIFGDAPWTSTVTYEPLTVVLYEGNSFTSRQFVPIGIDIANEEYWAETGNYNAQIENYRREVADLSSHVDYAYDTVSKLKSTAKTSGIVTTRGYYDIGDGGGATYVISSAQSSKAGDVPLSNGMYALLLSYEKVLAAQLGIIPGRNNLSELLESAMPDFTEIEFGAGEYVLASTVSHASTPCALCGDRHNTHLKYTGTGFMFNTTADYANRLSIKGFYIEGGSNSLINCNHGRFGGSVTVENCRIVGFTGELIHFTSAFNCLIRDVRIVSSAKFVFDSVAGDPEQTFSNLNVFENVYATGFSHSGNPDLFCSLDNARFTFFNECQIEKYKTCFTSGSNVNGLILNESWIERIDTVVSGAIQNLKTVNTNFALITEYNGASVNVDGIDNNTTSSTVVRNGNSNTLATLFNEASTEHTLYTKNVLNPSAPIKYYPLYTLTSKKEQVMVPKNVLGAHALDADTTSINLEDTFSNNAIMVKFECTCYSYKGGAYSISRFPVYQFNDNSYRVGAKTVELDGGTTLNLSAANKVLTLTASQNVEHLVLAVEFNVLGRGFVSF